MKERGAFVAKLLTLHKLKIFSLYFTKYSPCKRCSVGPRNRNRHRTNTYSISCTILSDDPHFRKSLISIRRTPKTEVVQDRYKKKSLNFADKLHCTVVLLSITPCNLTGEYQRFGETSSSRLHIEPYKHSVM